MEIEVNSLQTRIKDLELEKYPEEIQEQFDDFINNVPYIKSLISPNRPRANQIERDQEGKIIVDITKPHILENMDYFRQPAITFQREGKYTNLRPNPNPNSEYGKWVREEVRRCYEGLIRPSDGEWITGDMYFFLNYCPMQLIEKDGKNRGKRVVGFPRFWEGHYYLFHYLQQARESGKHAFQLASRARGKSFIGAGMLAKRFLLGESKDVNKKVVSYITASDKKYIQGGDQTLDKFIFDIDHCGINTQFPSRRLVNSLNKLEWVSGYKDLDTETNRGTLNAVIGVSSSNDEAKLRGTRGVLYILEEMGTFPKLLDLYGNMRHSVEQGNITYGTIFAYGTAGDNDSDFSSAQEIMYNPNGYNVYSVDNVYDKEGQSRQKFVYFFPGYMNFEGFYDKDGNSDVTGALLELLKDRYNVKYNSQNVNAITKRIAESPIVPQEAVLRARGNMFPMTQLNERIAQLDSNPNSYDDVYIGDLAIGKDGKVIFVLTNELPIRDFPLKDNTSRGAIEIYSMPVKNREDKIIPNRYIGGFDPYDNDQADSQSLGSFYILDLFTDRLVLEYTGRTTYADELYEKFRLALLFYNAKGLYEAHPYSQKVHLSNGNIIEWKDVNIGSELLAPNGKTVRVIDIPINEYMPIYKITLADNREIFASDNHIWEVFKLNNPKKRQLFTTSQMMQIGTQNKHGQNNFFIPNSGIVNYSYREVPIDPYTMGLILAEGSIIGSHCSKNQIQISSNQEDMKFYENNIPYQIKYIGTKGYSYSVKIPNCKQIFKELGLLNSRSETKFIPDIYMYNSYQTRIELLKGLMDGDGCATKVGANIYITTSFKLASNISSLCRSLGINCKVSKFSTVALDAYRIYIYTEQVIFKLPRKIQNQHIYKPYNKGSKANSYINKTAIISIEFSHYEMGKCVTVDSEDGLYLIGDYVTTHNCNKKGCYAYFSRMNSTHLLADTPEYLRDKQLIKYSSFGSNAKGVNASQAINNYANALIKDWLIKPVPTVIKEDGEDKEIMVSNLYFIKCRALLKELVLFNPDINVDRVRALGMVMLYREEFMILYQGNISEDREEKYNSSYLGNDDFFTRNYKGSKFSQNTF